jgi:hypothetical protein
MKKIILITIVVIFLFIANSTFAQSKILINEFLIDPQPQSVEILNSGTESADISDWIIDDSGGVTFYTIPTNNIILPNQCLVFSADFNLNKSSADTIRFINNSQQLIDSFAYKSSSGSGISYLRQPDGTNNWATGSANLGKFNSNTEQTCLFPTLTPTLTLEPTLTLTPTLTIENPTPTLPAVVLTEASTVSYDNIYLSEAMVYPTTGEKEWIEIYNNNDFSVSLNNWFIDDLENTGSSPKIFSLNINAKSYGILELTSSIFNNDGDNVRLLDFNKNLKDDFEYGKTAQGKTLGRTSFDSDNFCLQELSKNSVNNPCINPTSTPITPTPTGRIVLSSIIKNVPSDISTLPVARQVHQNINYPTGIVQNNYDNGDILGSTNKLIINSPNNKLFINFLTFLACFYSLLVIISVLFKNKTLNKYALAS